MSRFEKFQNRRVFDEKGNPLNEQIIVHDCIINFEAGFISNWDNETEGETDCPAISCIDGHIEYWENGVLNKTDGPAVISPGDDIIEYWENGKINKEKYYQNNDNEYEENDQKENLSEKQKKLFEKGRKAESDFSKYLHKHKIPHIHLSKLKRESYSEILGIKDIKRPDYMIFIDKKPFFIEVKATGCYTINQIEIDKQNALKNEFGIDVIFAVTDIKEDEFNDYSFMKLDNLNNYIKLKNKAAWYRYSKSLLKDKIIHNNIDNDELKKICSNKEQGDIHYYSDILEKYLGDNNFTMK